MVGFMGGLQVAQVESQAVIGAPLGCEERKFLPAPCFVTLESESEVAQSRPTLCDPMDCSPPGSSVHGIFQAGVLEWGAIAFSGRETTYRKNEAGIITCLKYTVTFKKEVENL